eukprot:TRINITY_DN9463_c0_g1_i1.p2 TRINITY_DN9463_c0_g1~~TRINITY_DN9463_c0_g1_i1.p2  ORF type:complete len:299 (-),score=87.26 TRINITY_DN9463_c0_g1_i1:86-982(-)
MDYDSMTTQHSIRLDNGQIMEHELAAMTWAYSRQTELRKERMSAEEALVRFGLRRDGTFEQLPLSRSQSSADLGCNATAGMAIEVFFMQGFNRWFRGTVVGMDDTTCKHMIEFDDGQQLEMDLRYEHWAPSKCTEPRSEGLSLQEGYEKYQLERQHIHRKSKPSVKLSELCKTANESCAATTITDMPNTLSSVAMLLGLSGGGVKMVGREQESAKIVNFVERAVLGSGEDGQKSALFVCGMPGCGKTALVSHVCKQLALWGKARHSLHLLELNAMHVLEPRSVYSKVLCALVLSLIHI